MGKGRLEAFSDGVIAIIISIMVLELKVPLGSTVDVLIPLIPVLGSYVLSFVYVGIYWNKLQYGSYPLHAVIYHRVLTLSHDKACYQNLPVAELNS